MNSSFHDYLKQITIPKHIDPGPESKPKEPEKKSIVDEIAKVSDITPLNLIVEDLIDLATNVQNDINSTITNIVGSNNNPAFIKYHEMVKANHFNPKDLLTDSSLQPNKIYGYIEIKSAEKNVYREVSDLRAPFIVDLYDMLSEAGLSEYSLVRNWKSIINGNQLYPSIDNSRIVRYALAKEREYLIQLRESNTRILENRYQVISYSFTRRFVEKILSRSMSIDVSSQLSNINALIKVLEQVKVVLQIAEILNFTDWSKFRTNLADIFNDFLQLTAERVMRDQSYSLIVGCFDNISDLLWTLDTELPNGIELFEAPELKGIKDQVFATLATELEAVENDFLFREAHAMRTEESRQLMILNSQKNSETKQYIHVVDEIIQFLYEIKASLSTINESIHLDIEILTENAFRRVSSPRDGSTSSGSKIIKYEK